MSELDRFFNKIIIMPNGCWLWVNCLNKDGYGYFNLGGETMGAHRASYNLLNGEIPEGKKVLHSCDNPSCVCPFHLRIGTQLDNIADMVSRQRQKGAVGLNNCKTKLTEEDVMNIYNSNDVKIDLAKKFNITYRQVWAIQKSKLWKHLTNKNYDE